MRWPLSPCPLPNSSMSPPCPPVPTIPSPFPPLPHALPTPKMAAAASAECQEPGLSLPGRRSAGFLAKMAAPSGRSGRGLWGAVVAAAALLWLGARAAEGPSTAEFDVRPGGEVHSFSRSLVRAGERRGYAPRPDWRGRTSIFRPRAGIG